MKWNMDLYNIWPFFPNAFINSNNELILEPKNNVYFRLDNIESNLDFDCKMLEYVSRPAHKGTHLYWQKWLMRGLNSYFRKVWTVSDISTIYTRLGNGVNRRLCKEFILNGFDLKILEAVK